MVLSGEGHGAPLQSSCPENPMDGRSLVGRSPRGRSQSDTTERLPLRVSLSRLGGGHGNPLQCSCLENPRDGGARWATVCGVAQIRTRPKRRSSSSSNLVEKSFSEEDLSSFFLFLHGPVPVSDISKVASVDPLFFSGWLPMG